MLKQWIAIEILLLLSLKGFTQNVGIGTNAPVARLHVIDSSVLFSGSGFISLPAANPPISGAGSRMMWYAQKAAFRTGYVNGVQWDNDSIGAYSFAAGVDTKAKGNSSVALGNTTTASANYSMAIGTNTLASGEYSTAMGFYSTASGIAATALGNSNAQGLLSSSFGQGTIAKGYSSTVIGLYNDSILTVDQSGFTSTTPLFIVGNGNSPANRSNALTVLKNGNVGIGVSDPVEKLQVSGIVKASTYQYNTPKTHYYAIPCIEFASVNSGYLVFNQNAAGGAYISNAPGIAGLNAPLHLPDGALLLSLQFDFWDASATQDLQGTLITQPLDGYGVFAGVQSSGNAGNSIHTMNFGAGLTINNQTTAYFVYISASTGAWNTVDLRIKRVIAAYSLAEAQ